MFKSDQTIISQLKEEIDSLGKRIESLSSENYELHEENTSLREENLNFVNDKQRYKSALLKANIPIAIVDEEEIVFANLRFSELMSLRTNTLDISKVMPTNSFLKIRNNITYLLDGKMEFFSRERIELFNLETDEIIVLFAMGSLVEWKNDRPSVLMIFDELNDDKRLTDMYREQEKEISKLKNTIDMQSQVIKTFHHDLRSPVLSNKGLIKALEKKVSKMQQKKDARTEKNLSVLGENADKLLKVMDDLRKFMTVANNVEINENVDLTDVLSYISRAFKPTLRSGDVRGQLIYPSGKKTKFPPIKGLEAHFIQIFYNLVSNSVKFRRPAEKLKIEVDWLLDVTGNLRISVKDNGIGVPEHRLKDIFEDGNRLNDKVEGSGIGLHQVKKTIEEFYSGEVEAKNGGAKNRGLTIFLTIGKSHLVPNNK